jgi:hypothetical protein
MDDGGVRVERPGDGGFYFERRFLKSAGRMLGGR